VAVGTTVTSRRLPPFAGAMRSDCGWSAVPSSACWMSDRAGQLQPVDRDDAVARSHVETRLCQRRRHPRVEVAAGIDLRQAVAIAADDVVRAEQPARNAAGARNGAAAPAQMADGKGAQHVLKDVVEVRARGDRGNIGFVTALVGDGGRAVEVRIIKIGSLHAPYLVVHLHPFRRRVHAHLKIGQRQRTVARLERGICGDDDPGGTYFVAGRLGGASGLRLERASNIFSPSAESSKFSIRSASFSVLLSSSVHRLKVAVRSSDRAASVRTEKYRLPWAPAAKLT